MNDYFFNVFPPVVIGDGGSQMQLKLDKPSTVHFWCDKKSDWFTNWVSVEELLPETIDCFADNMRYVKYVKSPDVKFNKFKY